MLMFSFASLTAEASDYDYNGAIDPFTGEPADEEYYYTYDEEEEDTVPADVWITDDYYYSYENECYVYPVDEQGGCIYCSVADGMVVQNNVDFSATENVEPTVYLNGNVISYEDGQLSYTGSYIVTIMNGGSEEQIFTFEICGEMSNDVMEYVMPEGFEIISVSLNGEDVSFSPDYVDMSEEGKYYVAYECYKNSIGYSLALTVDVTPPTLTLEGVGENGRAHGPVNIINEDPDASLSISRDGQQYPMVFTSVLTQSGRYVVTVTDKAGNYTEYQFIIMIYLERYSIILLIIFVLLVIAAGVYIYYTRTHLKTR